MTDNDPSAQDRHTPEPGTPEQPNPEAHTGSSEREDTERYREGGQGTDEFRYPPRTPIGDYAQGGYPTSPHTQSGYTAYSLGPTQSSPERRGMSGRLVAGVALLALLVGGGAGAATGYLAADTATESSAPNALNQPPPPARQTGNAPEGSVEAVAEKLKPSVVQLQVRGFGSANEGSGFILSEDGYILTNNHVVEAAARGGRITVVFHDGEETSARIMGRDPTTDIAVVRAENVSGLTTVELGRSDDLRVGESVVAIGSPYELAGTVTAGIVSSLNRPVTAGGQGDQTTVMDAIQTDAAINPGNSGGPLANMQGQVIGINSAIYSPSQGGNVGIGFAIPIDQARRTADEIIKNGHATQTYIGATVGNAPSGGAVIGDVESGSPAEQAGLKSGDVVVKMDDRRIEDANALVASIRTRAPGEKATFTLADGNTVEVTLGGQPVRVN